MSFSTKSSRTRYKDHLREGRNSPRIVTIIGEGDILFQQGADTERIQGGFISAV